MAMFKLTADTEMIQVAKPSNYSMNINVI